MTIIATDLKILAADSLVTAGDVKVYNRSKIRILKQHAIASTGLEHDGDRFEQWFFNQNGEPFNCEESFSVIVMTTTKILVASTGEEDSLTLAKMAEENRGFAIGMQAAGCAAEALMKFARFNAHNAAVAAANFNTHCGEPVHSITKKQLQSIHPDFDGYWVGNYKIVLTQLDKYLITRKQWLKT